MLMVLAITACNEARDQRVESPATVPTSTPKATAERFDGGVEEPGVGCTLVYGGRISGRVTHGGEPVPDGTFVSLVFAGGPLQKTRTEESRYSLPLLARQCPDGRHWIGFAIWAGGRGQNVHPNSEEVQLDLEAPDIPAGVPSDLPECEFFLGTVSGQVKVGGKPAPDGTVVSTTVGLPQAVATVDGEYSLSSIGTRCDGEVNFLQMTLSALGTPLTITPLQADERQDIIVPD